MVASFMTRLLLSMRGLNGRKADDRKEGLLSPSKMRDYRARAAVTGHFIMSRRSNDA
jgi:hypothetical protein